MCDISFFDFINLCSLLNLLVDWACLELLVAGSPWKPAVPGHQPLWHPDLSGLTQDTSLSLGRGAEDQLWGKDVHCARYIQRGQSSLGFYIRRNFVLYACHLVLLGQRNVGSCDVPGAWVWWKRQNFGQETSWNMTTWDTNVDMERYHETWMGRQPYQALNPGCSVHRQSLCCFVAEEGRKEAV
jgi:hypothetical protein